MFKGKHVLVTGGTGTCATMVMWGGFSKSQHAEGIGLETAMDLLRRGAFVSVCSRSSTKVDAAVATLRELTTSLDGQGARTRVFGKAADVTVAAEVWRLLTAPRATTHTLALCSGGCCGGKCGAAVWPH